MVTPDADVVEFVDVTQSMRGSGPTAEIGPGDEGVPPGCGNAVQRLLTRIPIGVPVRDSRSS